MRRSNPERSHMRQYSCWSRCRPRQQSCWFGPSHLSLVPRNDRNSNLGPSQLVFGSGRLSVCFFPVDSSNSSILRRMSVSSFSKSRRSLSFFVSFLYLREKLRPPIWLPFRECRHGSFFMWYTQTMLPQTRGIPCRIFILIKVRKPFLQKNDNQAKNDKSRSSSWASDRRSYPMLLV